MYLAKKKQIQETQIAKLRESMEEKERKEKSQAEEREKLLKQLNEYGGLWEDAEVEEKVATFLTEKEKKSALKVQLCFRQKVIGSKCHRSYFTMSSGGKMKPITLLIDNLRFVCRWSSGEPSSETESDYSQPSLINPAILKNQKESYKETALKTTEKMTEKDMEIEGSRKRVKLVKEKGSAKKSKISKTKDRQVPVVSSASALVGKIIGHFCFLGNEDTERWFRGVVLESIGKSQFLVRYHDFPDETFSQPLYKDFKAYRVKLVELVPSDLIGASIGHLFYDNDTEENVWWDAEVVDIDVTSEDKNNPNYFIWYEDCGTMDEENLEGQEYYLEPLLNDYLNHCVQVLSLDLDQDQIEE